MAHVRLDDTFMETARKAAIDNRRTTPKQIEHWARIGRIMEANPDLTYEFVKNAEEAANGEFTKRTKK